MNAVTIMVFLSLVLLVAALLLSIYRLAKGPNALDRAVAVDVFSAAVIAVVIILIVYQGRADLRALLIVFVLTAFFSTVSVSRFIMVGRNRRPRGPVVPLPSSGNAVLPRPRIRDAAPQTVNLEGGSAESKEATRE